jgi:TPR repeat protein
MSLAAAMPARAGLAEGIAAFESERYDKAVAELTPLAQAGNPEAMRYLAEVYDDGLGNVAKALPWYQRAAGKGEPRAEARLGELYDKGHGVPRDTDMALDWYGKAAAQGDDEAEAALGDHYHNDLNDNAMAAHYYGLAAAQGNTDARYSLGLLLLGEPGVARDVSRAWLYLSLAAAELDEAGEARDVLELRMSPAEMAAARKLLDDWKKSH